MTVTMAVASIKGTYLGDVTLADHAPPGAFTLKASGSGGPGTLSADVRVRLDDRGDGTTVLDYDADAVVGGAVGGVGQRVLSGVARKTAGQFFDAVDALLIQRAGAPTAVPAHPATAPDAVDVPDAAPAVFTRPDAPATRRGNVRVDVRSQLGGTVVGAAIALLGVYVGWKLSRRGD
jgi:hypothetical protein